jgi:hypothetical protein
MNDSGDGSERSISATPQGEASIARSKSVCSIMSSATNMVREVPVSESPIVAVGKVPGKVYSGAAASTLGSVARSSFLQRYRKLQVGEDSRS